MSALEPSEGNGRNLPDVDITNLPWDVKEKLAQLQLELSEGDITQKGYDKKRSQLLAPYLPGGKLSGKNAAAPPAFLADGSPRSRRLQRRHHRRMTTEENRYHSEIRTEAVQAALSSIQSPSGDGDKLSPQRQQPQSKLEGGGDASDGRGATPTPTKSATPAVVQPVRRPTMNLGNGGGKRRTKGHSESSSDEESVTSISAGGGDTPTPQPQHPSGSATQLQPRVDPPELPVAVPQAPAAVRHTPRADQRHKRPPDKSRSGSKHNNRNRSKGATERGDIRLVATSNGNGATVIPIEGANSVPPPDVTTHARAALEQQRRHQQRVQQRHDQRRGRLQQQGTDKQGRATTPHRQTPLEGDTRAESNRNSVALTSVVPGSTLVEPDVIYQNTRPNLLDVADVTDSPGDYQNAVIRPAKVSVKIQQLLQTLQRPRKKPLHEYYYDDDAELEAIAHMVDPSAPRPEGALVTPARGEPLPSCSQLQDGGAASRASGVQTQQQQQWPRSLEAALARHAAINSGKTPVAQVLDPAGRLSNVLTYGKLQSRSQKVAHLLLHKLHAGAGGRDAQPLLKSGDRVALVYPNNDPVNFMVAFHGCLAAGIVPVPIEVPLAKRDATMQQLGFLLGSCGVRAALTSEACLKGLPKCPNGDVAQLRGWPLLKWVTTEHLARPSKDWRSPALLTDDTTSYIESTANGTDASVRGVCVSRAALLQHCKALCHACEYRAGESVVCVLDYKREVGLWHSVLASVYCGLSVVFVPYAVMKMNPASWLHLVGRTRAAAALVKSRDLHWGLLATRDRASTPSSKNQPELNLAPLRMLLVADGANPWSLSSCDQFVNHFQTFGLRPDALCPCAGSSETLTVSIRRPGRTGAGSSGRGVLSMAALSHCVVRVDQANSLTSLTMQDAGQVLPGCVAAVVRLSGQPRLCRADELGEICLYGRSTSDAYWGLDGRSQATFRVEPIGVDDRPIGAVQYVRSGLIGFLGPSGLLFVCGQRSGLMHVSGRYHSSDDLIATVLAVEPMKFVYRGRIAVFSVTVLRDERIVIVCEQKQNIPEEESFRWMSRVLQAVDSIHQVGVYCLALVAPNQLPKTPLGGIHVSETRQRFSEGCLRPTNLLMCPHTCVTNLPKPREPQPDVGPAAMMVGNLVQGARIAAAKGRDVGPTSDDDRLLYLAEVLRQRAQTSPDHVLYTLLNAKGHESAAITCAALQRRAEKIGCLLLEKARLSAGEHVALIFAPGVDLICAFYGCLVVGLVPVCIRPPHAQNLSSTLPTVRMIVDVSRSVAIVSSQQIIKLLRSKEASHKVDVKAWPSIVDVDELPKRRLSEPHRPQSPSDTCYLDFSVSTTGTLAGIVMSHGATAALCKSLKLAHELYPSRHVVLCLDPYAGLGFALWVLSSVYSGHHSVLIPPAEIEQNPALWLTTVSQLKVRDTFCSYGVLELCVRELAAQLPQLAVNLSAVRTCVVVAEERPRVALTQAFIRLFSSLGLPSRALSTSFGCRVNVAICMQGAASPDPCTVYVDARALRNDRVTLVEKGAPHSLALVESGKLLPGVKVVIANPETRGQCADSHLGEIWVAAPHNAKGYFSVYGEESGGGQGVSAEGTATTRSADHGTDHFCSRLSTGDTRSRYARTGYLGFLRQTGAVTADGGLHDAVFVVGALDETLMLRGARYHPVDIELTVTRSHKLICEAAVFAWTNLLVTVAELDASDESDALDLVPAVTAAVLEQHRLIVGVVVIVDPATIPINSRGEKQRMHLRDAFLHDQLDPIYVAYNM